MYSLDILGEKLIPKLTSEQQIYLYNLGVKKFTTANYKHATEVFRFLNLIAPDNSLYTKALAGAYHAQKDYQLAIFWYNHIYMQSPKTKFDCLLYAGIAYYETGDLVQASAALSQFLQNYSAVANTELIAKAKLYIELIEQINKKQGVIL